MKRPCSFFLILGGLFAILSCQNSGISSDEELSPVHFVAKSAENAWAEKGIDAVSEADAIYIEWLTLEDSEIRKYEIYRKHEEDEDFMFVNSVEDTFYIDHDVELNKKYFYYVLAENFDGMKSASSDTVHYQLLEKPSRLFPYGTVSETQTVFQWVDVSKPQYYIIRVKQAENDQSIWLAGEILPNYESDQQQVLFNNNGSAEVNELSLGITYQWRVDVVGPGSNCGSESTWTSFIIQ